MRPALGLRTGVLLRGALCVFALATPGVSAASPYDYLSVGDPVESELRVLDLFDSNALTGRILLPHLGTRPLEYVELQGLGAPPASPPPAVAISLARLERVLGRERGPLFAPHPEYSSTPRLLDYGSDLQLLQLSAGIEGSGYVNRYGHHFDTNTGLHGRASMGLDRLVVFSHYVVGRVDHARLFADPIIPDNDLIVLPEETYIAYTDESVRWGAQFGRLRWHLGPGEEGSLVLSKTAPLMTGLSFHTRLNALRADAIAISATLKQAAGEQLAAHRLEWQPLDGMRIGVTEAARYQSSGWRPLYLIGAIPYVLVQRLERQNELDSVRFVRNNVLQSFDASWRIFDGARVYGELVLDDIHARSGSIPNKFAFQFGYEGVGSVGPGRLTWCGEFTRLTRYVYTSFFGRDYAINGQSLGFPVGPDVRRIRLRVSWDPGPDWQISAYGTHTDKGENDIDEPFVPGSPRVNSSILEGVVQTTQEAELALTWWPASGVMVAASGAYAWIRNAEHLRGARRREPSAALQLRLLR